MGLIDGANSDYIKASNALFKRRDETYVYVEDQMDVAFWDVFIRKYKDVRNFVITPAINEADNSPVCGKANVFKHHPISSLGPYKWLCLDSDYDEIIPNYPNSNPKSLKCTFVIRTYVYAIENMKCDVSNFHDYILKSTLSSMGNESMLHHVYNEISRFLWEIMPIHLVSVYQQDKKYYQEALRDDLNGIRYHHRDSKAVFTTKVDSKILDVKTRLSTYITANQVEIATFKQMLHSRCNNNPNLTYLLINGHVLFDYTASVLENYCLPLREERLHEIANSRQLTYRDQQRNKYLNKTRTKDGLKKRIESLITDSTSYEQNPFYATVQERIDKAMAASKILELAEALEVYKFEQKYYGSK